jgi:hypothetical protein
MSIDRLLFECTSHYRDRGFPESAISHLRWVLVSNTRNGQINLQTEHPKCDKRVDQLLGHFTPCKPPQAQDDLSGADAVFGFAFGYRMKQWTARTRPTDDSEVESNRIPGANNEALADQAIGLYKMYKHDLYMQFEISDAIGAREPVEFKSTRKDQGTRKVLEEFVSHAMKDRKPIHTVILVAHRHHFDRCRLLLEQLGVRALRLAEMYSGYDLEEAQPRVMSPEECIVNDFASMAGMV